MLPDAVVNRKKNNHKLHTCATAQKGIFSYPENCKKLLTIQLYTIQTKFSLRSI